MAIGRPNTVCRRKTGTCLPGFDLSAGNASQEDGQLGKVVDIGGAVNTMVMHLARANLAGTIQQVAASAMGLQQKLEVDRARQKQQQQ